MAKGFQIEGNDFDVLFEAPYTNFNTTTFSGVSPTCKYCTRYFGDNPNGGVHYYAKNGTHYDASPRGFLPSNYKVATISTTGKWMKIQRESTGFSVTVNNSTTTYRNSNRGSYPINRVGLVFCGGGAGGGGGGAYVEMDGDAGFYANWSAGNGGGGGATVAVTLWLDKYTYYLYLGAGGSGGGSSTSSSSGGQVGGNGGASYLRLTSSSGTLLATANGGKCDQSEAAATINNSSYTTTVATAKGGYGGAGGACYDMYQSLEYDYGYADDIYQAGSAGSSGTLSGYFSQQVSGARINQSNSGIDAHYDWTSPDGNSYWMGAGGEGRSAMDTTAGCGGRGGDAGYNQGSWSVDAYAENGGSGKGGRAFFYY